MIIVQHIVTVWTKQSRGMPGSKTRASVPKALGFPLSSAPGDSILVHKVVFEEQDSFQAHEKAVAAESDNHYWSLWFERESSIRVRFDYCQLSHGLPVRKPTRQLIFDLAQGDLGSLCINGRFASYSGQWYMDHVVNIAHVDEPSPRLFLDSVPSRIVDKRAALF
jgi:hypothetical protein